MTRTWVLRPGFHFNGSTTLGVQKQTPMYYDPQYADQQENSEKFAKSPSILWFRLWYFYDVSILGNSNLGRLLRACNSLNVLPRGVPTSEVVSTLACSFDYTILY